MDQNDLSARVGEGVQTELMTVVSRDKGGRLEFLKRSHVVDAGYNQLTRYPEIKHVSAMFERYSKANGKQPKDTMFTRKSCS